MMLLNKKFKLKIKNLPKLKICSCFQNHHEKAERLNSVWKHQTQSRLAINCTAFLVQQLFSGWFKNGLDFFLKNVQHYRTSNERQNFVLDGPFKHILE